MTFTKEDLTGEYTWTPDFEPLSFTGGPSRRIFDRYSGNQLLFIVNHLAALSELFSTKDIQKIEDKIMHELPLDIQSEISVVNWLKSQTV